jgi:autotransporter family porin
VAGVSRDGRLPGRWRLGQWRLGQWRLRGPAGAAVAAVLLAGTAVGVTVAVRTGAAGRPAAAAAPAHASGTPTGSPAPPGSPSPAASGSVPPSSTPSGAGPAHGAGTAPGRFATLPPGAALPSGTQCATRVRAHPYPESKGSNAAANRTTGHGIGSAFFSGDDPRANTGIAARVDGQFTGTTREILRWAACKWGVDEDLVLAQAAVESWWRQDTLGDWTSDASRCAPGRGLGVDGKAGQCPESFGILQNRYPYEKSGWPGIARSTAMNADLAYAIWRVCFEGYESWLNTVDRGRDYAAGDAWGCVGRWFSGRWHTAPGDQYVTRVRGYLDQRIWDTANFQQP